MPGRAISCGQRICPGWPGTVEEAIAYLESDPRQYSHEFNGGET